MHFLYYLPQAVQDSIRERNTLNGVPYMVLKTHFPKIEETSSA